MRKKPAPPAPQAPRLDARVLAWFRARGAEGGRLGGLKGGKARWKGVSAEARRAHAKKAAAARWRKTTSAKKKRATE